MLLFSTAGYHQPSTLYTCVLSSCYPPIWTCACPFDTFIRCSDVMPCQRLPQVNSLVSGRDITGVAAFRAPPARKRAVGTSEGQM